MSRIRPGSLKCVVLARPEIQARVSEELEARVGTDNVRALGSAALLVHAQEQSDAVRDWLQSHGDILVVEFEKWSAYGDAVPREWLGARGH